MDLGYELDQLISKLESQATELDDNIKQLRNLKLYKEYEDAYGELISKYPLLNKYGTLNIDIDGDTYIYKCPRLKIASNTVDGFHLQIEFDHGHRLDFDNNGKLVSVIRLQFPTIIYKGEIVKSMTELHGPGEWNEEILEQIGESMTYKDYYQPDILPSGKCFKCDDFYAIPCEGTKTTSTFKYFNWISFIRVNDDMIEYVDYPVQLKNAKVSDIPDMIWTKYIK